MRRLRSLLALRRGFCSSSGSGDYILSCVSSSEEIEIHSVKADALVRQAQRTLQTSRMSSIVLGNAMMGSVLFSSIFPEANAITISTVCDGRLGFVHAATTFDGFTTGHVHNPSHSSHGNMIMATVVRECDMRLSISLSKSHRTFVSPMGPSREVAESLAYFLWKNQKMDTAASLAMKFDEHNIVKTARGFIIQVYPLSEKFACHQLRENIENSPSLADLDDTDARDIIEKLLHGIEPGSFSQRDLKFQPVGEEEQQRFLGQREKLFSSNQARTYEKMINNPTSQDFEETKLPPQHPSDLYKLANGAFTSKIGTTRRGPRRPEIRMPRMVHTPSRERSFKRHGGINEQEMTENGFEQRKSQGEDDTAVHGLHQWDDHEIICVVPHTQKDSSMECCGCCWKEQRKARECGSCENQVNIDHRRTSEVPSRQSFGCQLWEASRCCPRG
ncbi:uncharacterized protein LOC9639977 [Selaginella moellendorffii]|uniref:uncharacterized protein LOC9639977 n=2 Tax=Selaginella moellendorffii TaxID=88036 RepID=UPI000D1CB16A|nr:uncharacterized protein LOC9639977 [Selaginella moellendorffii]|eukprot:XP_024532174.1 uncharacterized protein LOC9639977 [Selaginella moellendorffii]